MSKLREGKRNLIVWLDFLSDINFCLGKYICHIYVFSLEFHATNFHKNKNFIHITGETEIYTQ